MFTFGSNVADAAVESRIAPCVLVVDDDENIRTLLGRLLGDAGCRVEAFGDAESCISAMDRLRPDAVVLDLGLPGMNGIEALAKCQQLRPDVPIIILTADAATETVVNAMRHGAFDYVAKPFSHAQIILRVNSAIERSRLGSSAKGLVYEAVDGEQFEGMLGRTPCMLELYRQVDRVARTAVTVLIRGESGSGKELVARAIHARSRRQGQCVAINGAAIPESLLDSEMFGVERGSFTGAIARRHGFFEQANRGTFFLDEVGELSAAGQGKLLRVLQERTFRRVGGASDIHSDFRFVAATNRDLAGEVAAGRFREDLYFRVSVVEIEVPPLRSRQADIPLLVGMFIRQYSPATGNGRRLPKLLPDAMDALLRYDWPGNVRELSNAVDHAMVAASGRPVRLADLPLRIRQAAAGVHLRSTLPARGVPGGEPQLSGRRLDLAERQVISEAVGRHGSNLAAVARDLGISRTTLYRKLKKYALKTSGHRPVTDG